jgi:hypothetical protein
LTLDSYKITMIVRGLFPDASSRYELGLVGNKLMLINLT